MPPLQPRKQNSKNKRAASVFAVIAVFAALLPLGAGPAFAYPMVTPEPHGPPPTPSPSPSANPNELPFDSSLIFVLDDRISSDKSRTDDVVRAHLRDPIVLGGRTITPTGTPATIRILRAVAAQSGDVYGYVEIFFEPMALPNGSRLPLRAPTSRLNANVTAGHESTVGIEDTVEDIFIPYAILYQAFRKGRNFELGPGSEIRARTEAVLMVGPNGAVAVATPRPIGVELQTPHSSYTAYPLATPIDTHKKPTPIPSITPEPPDVSTPAPLTPAPIST
ncbi:MAG: hypothetical protein ACLQPV_08330 [Vulcanimicrobiaceae bacterium]